LTVGEIRGTFFNKIKISVKIASNYLKTSETTKSTSVLQGLMYKLNKKQETKKKNFINIHQFKNPLINKL
jgi:hypothetical protein